MTSWHGHRYSDIIDSLLHIMYWDFRSQLLESSRWPTTSIQLASLHSVSVIDGQIQMQHLSGSAPCMSHHTGGAHQLGGVLGLPDMTQYLGMPGMSDMGLPRLSHQTDWSV